MTGIALATSAAASASAAGGGPGPPAGTLAATVGPAVAYGYWQPDFFVGLIEAVGVTPSGGVEPYSMVWSLISGEEFSMFVGSGPPWYTQFQFVGPALKQAVYRATVTDALGAVATGDVELVANPS